MQTVALLTVSNVFMTFLLYEVVRHDTVLSTRGGGDGQELPDGGWVAGDRLVCQWVLRTVSSYQSLHVQQQGGVTVATNAKGDTLFIAQTLPDGGILITDATGKRVASYPAQEVERLAASVSK